MFQDLSLRGDSGEFWDANWDASNAALLQVNDRVCENQPQFRILREKIRTDRTFLEGGCGPAHWVKYFHVRGVRAIGVDFAPRTVARINRLAPELDVRLGDVRALPLQDGQVDVYYSGGVAEHFESGPEPVLAEAARVIAPRGWFLCSIPDESSLRRLLYWRRRNDVRWLNPALLVNRVQETQGEPAPKGYSFFQYLFREAEFRQRLNAAGFDVVSTFGYSLLWGLLEAPGFSFLRSAGQGAVEPGPSRPASASTPIGQRLASLGRGWREIARGALVREDASTPWLGSAVRFALEHCANMRMYVAQRRC